MKTYTCLCENSLFFDSVECVRCQRPVGLCSNCLEIVARQENHNCPNCGVALNACQHRSDICNVWAKSDQQDDLCRFCRLTTVIPDLKVSGNAGRWKALEDAKRRVLVGVEQAGFPTAAETLQQRLPLTFEFKADTEKEKVATGHANGCITINLREANPVEREKTRQQFGEPHRTLVGHFRHELGHFFWELLVKSQCLEAFRELFGDERNPSYADAQTNYYENGPQRDWPSRFISAYASMHPWEDFAETFATLLDMTAIVGTASHFGVPHPSSSAGQRFDQLLATYRQVGVMVNELNRDMGLVDLVPEVVVETVAQKLKFVLDLPNAS